MRTVAIAGYQGHVDNYAAALEAVGLTPMVTLDPEQAAGCAGLLLPGGGDVDPVRFRQENCGSRDIDPALDQAQFPVLGICRGHQLINVYFGGDLIQDLPTAEDHMAHDHADSVHPVSVAPGSLLCRLYGAQSTVNSSHHQGLGAMGAGLRATAWAPDGTIEAAEHGSLPILTVQFHPERMAFAHARADTADGRRVFEWFRGAL